MLKNINKTIELILIILNFENWIMYSSINNFMNAKYNEILNFIDQIINIMNWICINIKEVKGIIVLKIKK